ncbi:MAG: translation elongation factor 4, partial [Deltaproteobacteria bacterium]|nr:translation elongation factor 4 [Deltaproteobacteria bacterium]
MDSSRIRNFCIIAHIDHGKSTLADRLLEHTGALSEREKTDQFLDKMELERERGITIKASPVRLEYRSRSGEDYVLNLIDTPGHVDFTYEVSRSLAACEGAILVVDAAQGVEAQTVANVYLALDHDLQVFPVINKIDLPSADPERVKGEIEDIIGLDSSQAILASAKQGLGTEEVLEGIVANFPPPQGVEQAPLRGLIFDSWFDPYHGAVILLRVFDGRVSTGDSIRLMSTGGVFEVNRLGVFAPGPVEVGSLGPGEVGFLMASIKNIREARIGDTVTSHKGSAGEPLEGFRPLKPMVFSGLYPTDSGQYQALRTALEKLSLNDSSFTYEPETSQALGFGFRCGFLGLLHLDIVHERVEREFDLSLITTAPTGVYQVTTHGGEVLAIDNPVAFPNEADIETIEEPFIRATIHLPQNYLGAVLKLCEEKRGVQQELRYAGLNRAMVTYELPLNEIVYDFYDRLKSLSRGYASMDYEMAGMRASKLVKLDVRINGDLVDAMSLIVHRDKAYVRGRDMVQRMRELIPRQLFEVVIQAAIGSRVIARESVKA